MKDSTESMCGAGNEWSKKTREATIPFQGPARAADARPGPEQQLLTSERCEAIQELLSQLPARAVLVAELRYFEELSHGEIADRTGLSERQIKQHLRRATDAIQEWMRARLLLR